MKPTAEEHERIMAWLDSTDMCNHCCHRVPKTEVAAGLHMHPAVMD